MESTRVTSALDVNFLKDS